MWLQASSCNSQTLMGLRSKHITFPSGRQTVSEIAQILYQTLLCRLLEQFKDLCVVSIHHDTCCVHAAGSVPAGFALGREPIQIQIAMKRLLGSHWH
jgi:hypothetical protein